MLKEAGKVKTVRGDTQFELEAKANESFRIRDIFIESAADEYVTLRVNKIVVGYFRTGGLTLGNHLHFPLQDEENATLFAYLNELGIFRSIPIPSGSVFTITGAHDSDSVVCVRYDEYDASDVSPNEPNGENSKDYDFVNYGRYSTTLAAGDNLYSVQQTSSAYPAFPFGKVVPSKHILTMHGLLFSDFARDSGTGTNIQKTTFLKLVKNRKTLFDDDLRGFPFIGPLPAADTTDIGIGQSFSGNYDEVDQRLPLIFDKALVFEPGDDIDLYVTTEIVAGAANILERHAEVGLIFTVRML